MVNWTNIDTVLLDVDGTLLDLHFDSHFWMDLVPRTLALRDSSSASLEEKITAARDHVWSLYEKVEGTLNWYCTDYWARTLDLPIMDMSHQIKHLVGFRPHAEDFLKWIGASDKKAMIVTNAHLDNFWMKADITGVDKLVDHIVSSHEYSKPKEHPEFWERLVEETQVDLSRSVLFDDNEAVLKMAKKVGVGQIVGIAQPNMQQPPREGLEFPAIQHFKEVFGNE